MSEARSMVPISVAVTTGEVVDYKKLLEAKDAEIKVKYVGVLRS